MQNSTDWSIINWRRTASKLLLPEEMESLSILAWDESWQAHSVWNFNPATVARYRNGLLLVRAAEDVDPAAVLRHELGHHLTLHGSGRFHKQWIELRVGIKKGQLKGCMEGAADSIGVLLGGQANPAYKNKADSDFNAGYQAGFSAFAQG